MLLKLFVVLLMFFLSHTVLGQPLFSAIDRPIVFVFGHPDDEVWIGGTMADLIHKGHEVHVVYVTSGSEKNLFMKYFTGPEDTNLKREHEAARSLRSLGISTAPIFLRYSHHNPGKQLIVIKDKLETIFRKIDPSIVITFGPGGITGHIDHIITGLSATNAVDQLPNIDYLLHIAIQTVRAATFNQISDQYDIHYKVKESAKVVSFSHDVSNYNEQRIQSFQSHPSQFSSAMEKAFIEFLNQTNTEDLIIARKRTAN
ncbi:MAG: PIG-L family deacetylase [Gammaproteobacteria bacterium]|nr:PIG-L family deacetylase [Gammaproteobacteria bacterium]